jgi:ribonuclease VapC
MNVFDASAVLAALNDEPGAATVLALLGEDDGVISAVNHAEVIAKLVDRQMPDADIDEVMNHLPLTVEPLTPVLARAAGLLRRQTRTLGLSLGDRCCLALGQARGATIVTADRAWAGLDGFGIKLVR